jgi:hypothetical protein
MFRTRMNLSGQRFGRWTVISDTGNHGKSRWNCQCDCGTERIVLGFSLKSGQSKSCGCSTYELLSKFMTGFHKKGGLIKESTARNRVLRAYRKGAESRGLVFNLTDTLFDKLIASPCFYCGQEPSNRQSTIRGGIFLYSGIDRKDASIGYTPDNVVACCFICNDMKGTLSYDDFIEQLNKISHHQVCKKMGLTSIPSSCTITTVEKL